MNLVRRRLSLVYFSMNVGSATCCFQIRKLMKVATSGRLSLLGMLSYDAVDRMIKHVDMFWIPWDLWRRKRQGKTQIDHLKQCFAVFFFYLALLLLCACSAAVNGLTPNSSLGPQDAKFAPSNGPDVVGTDHENTGRWPLVWNGSTSTWLLATSMGTGTFNLHV